MTIVEFDAVAESVGPARRRLVESAAAHGVPAHTLDDLALAVGEAIANVVRHAYDNDDDGLIYTEVYVEEGELNVVVADNGHGFRASGSPGLGMGLGIIAQSCSNFAIETNHPRGTVVRMRFPVTSDGPRAQTALMPDTPGLDPHTTRRETSPARGKSPAAAERDHERLATDQDAGALRTSTKPEGSGSTCPQCGEQMGIRPRGETAPDRMLAALFGAAVIVVVLLCLALIFGT